MLKQVTALNAHCSRSLRQQYHWRVSCSLYVSCMCFNGFLGLAPNIAYSQVHSIIKYIEMIVSFAISLFLLGRLDIIVTEFKWQKAQTVAEIDPIIQRL